MTDQDGLLVVRDLRVAFDAAAPVVDGVDVRVRPGRITAVVGESGSGKSLTATSVIGLLPANARTSGSILLDGEELLGRDPRWMRRVRATRIGTVFQEPASALHPTARIGTQFRHVLAVREGVVARDAARRRMTAQLEAVGLHDTERILRSYPHQISGGQQQRVLIALALTGDPDVLIADEPTTALDVTVQREILALLTRIVDERGLGVLLITHDMGVVAEVADEVTVLHRGRLVESGPVAQVLRAPAQPHTRELLASVPRLAQAISRPVVEVRGTAAPAAVVRDLAVDYGHGRGAHRALHGVSLEVSSGEIHGLVGESGSGKSTIGRVLMGMVPPAEGTVLLGGEELGAATGARRRALLAGVGVVFQDHAASLNPRRSVGWSISEPLLVAGEAGAAERRRRAEEALDRVRLPRALAERYPHELSGGQRQRVSIARALIRRPALLIADEPTSALDVTVQARVLEILRENVAEDGLSCLFISHDLAVVGALADRITVLRDGRVVESGPVREVLGAPGHAYTRALVDAVPSLDAVARR